MFRYLNLLPSTSSNIILPKIVELVVFIVLASKDVEFVVVHGTGHGGASLGQSLADNCHLGGACLNVIHAELGEFINARTVNETSENEE